MAVLKDYSSLGMVLWILLRQTDLGSFLMVAAKSIILAIIFSAATANFYEWNIVMVFRVSFLPTRN
jgi:hypothetical protein